MPCLHRNAKTNVEVPALRGGLTMDQASHAVIGPPTELTGLLLMEFGDVAMLRRMLRGIKNARAESRGQDPVA